MSYICKSCGSDEIGVNELVPRLHQIRVSRDEDGGLDWDFDDGIDARDELYYEASIDGDETSRFECFDCGLSTARLENLVTEESDRED